MRRRRAACSPAPRLSFGDEGPHAATGWSSPFDKGRAPDFRKVDGFREGFPPILRARKRSQFHPVLFILSSRTGPTLRRNWAHTFLSCARRSRPTLVILFHPQ